MKQHWYIPHQHFIPARNLAGTEHNLDTMPLYEQAIMTINEMLARTVSKVTKDTLCFTAVPRSYTYRHYMELYNNKERTERLLTEAGYTVNNFNYNPKTQVVTLTISWDTEA